MPKIRILVVDDAVVIRRLISGVLDDDPNFEVVGVAPNGNIALQKIVQVNPDAITLDVEMPVMDGLETVREIRKTHNSIPIIMFSTLTARGGEATLDALSAGASDYVTKPSNVTNLQGTIERLKSELIPKLKIHCRHLLSGDTCIKVPSSQNNILSSAPPQSNGASPKVLCIGSSTGGPTALADLFNAITVKFDIPVFIVQHMPPTFTQMLAERIDKLSPNSCCEAEDDQLVVPGMIYVAPGGKHMIIKKHGDQLKVQLTEDPPENSCRPAVDVTFRSATEHYGSSTLAVVLTGMGRDGFNGSEVVSEAGGTIVVQDEESSVVWGMPGCIAQRGLAHKILPLNQIASELMSRIN